MGPRPTFAFRVFDLLAAGRSTSAIHPPYDFGSLPLFCALAGQPAMLASSSAPAMAASIDRTANIFGLLEFDTMYVASTIARSQRPSNTVSCISSIEPSKMFNSRDSLLDLRQIAHTTVCKADDDRGERT
jgi:hypothetical protein